ncbi:acyl-CoA dehydrogenase [Pseudemcibacter aquimaris]|uniref:acyl-CoA dehydrogenase n=1 Tax=Pseudemcibacter aquimaris TaxID=2857064 RepID=UPI002012A877|nr:acyl-CoA dehydrogenase [Pseudemcibacter aquimaris]MCC3861321.1 acyl-CoA dehydrogenase [Pseudemcibacter aquimaris]WDU58093.1 acyl-CoA dehydrogenase [Pseudemcibacter aquimaris]
MSEYKAPVKEIKFTLDEVIGISEVTALEKFQDTDNDLIEAILHEGAKFAGEVLSPTYRAGDEHPATVKDGEVTTSPGFKEAYHQYCEMGWNGITANPEYGGQGLPHVLGLPIVEMVEGANTAFSLCPVLTSSAILAIDSHGTDEQKNTYLEKLITGEWTGTMNLTEPNAGSDVGALRSKAEKQDDGTYLIKGQKIFITYGEHDMAENIIHMVLARLPDAPAGTKGISLFIVPKYLVNDDGSIGKRNELTCVSLEHKMGIHGSPTCTMSFGDNDGCVGYLIGEENRGMMAMFTMMNDARLAVGSQGVACSERAYQMALEYASERVQGLSLKTRDKSPIIEHPDVRRMLMTMKSTTEAVRSIALLNAKSIDMAKHHPDKETAAKYNGLADLLTPLSKAYGSDLGIENSSLAMQVFGGMGYIEETGIAQVYRDARINAIYEGTNGIQAMDLTGRKLAIDNGVHWRALHDEIDAFVGELPETDEFASIKRNLGKVAILSRDCAEWLLSQHNQNICNTMAGSVPYLRMLSVTVGCYLLAKGAVAARKRLDSGDSDQDFLYAKINTSRFYAEQIVPTVLGLAEAIKAGDELFYAIDKNNMA